MTTEPNVTTEPPTGRQPRTLPDVQICRVRDIGITDFADCLVQNPFECKYAPSFGNGFLCQHPDWKEICQKTRAREQEDSAMRHVLRSH